VSKVGRTHLAALRSTSIDFEFTALLHDYFNFRVRSISLKAFFVAFTMDPLSLSASIAGLISITEMIAGRSYNYIKEARGASKEVRKLLEEITDLFGVLNSLRLVASRYEQERFHSTMQSQHIYTCHILLEKIKERLDKADPSQVNEKKSQFYQKASMLGRTLIWPFSSTETKGLIAEVEKQKGTLSLALAADGM